MASAYAYVADVVPYENLTMRFAILNSIYLLSCTVSGMLSGHLIVGLGYNVTFWMLAVLFAVSSVYVLFAVPESLPDDKRRKTLNISAMFWSTVNAFRIYTKSREQPRARFQLALLLIISMILSVMLLGMVDLETLYVLGPPYCFTSVQIGYFIALFSLIGVVAPVMAIPLFQLCVTDDIFGIMASLSGLIAFLLQGLATNTTQLFFGKSHCQVLHCLADITQ
jgi:MFS family permease